jgi:CheY-like chemotaxis protein
LARKILLADDSVTAQNMGRKILADAGYEVIAVNNGSAALKKIAELKPDLVILDVYMPGYSGLEVCQRLKESQETSRIPVLLSVGKLEPFKPEEAHRVRADAFIVKPFEASELLSALSKLEDKVVPRAEPSKPGRFARAIAAQEEASRSGAKEPSGDDNGWKSRIGFPHEKTAEERVADEPSIYNQMNRDLRTVVDKSPEPAAPLAQFPEAIQDAVAPIPPNLLNDVTPEEVAAIAAAVAQMQMATAAQDFAQLVPAASEERSEERSEAKPETQNENNLDTSTEPAPAAVPAATESEVSATMAAGGESEVAAKDAPRWKAVSVALDSEEASISLENEMRQAYAAFVATEPEQASTVAVSPAPELVASPAPVPAEHVPSATYSSSSAEPVTETPVALVAPPEPEPSSAFVSDEQATAAMAQSAIEAYSALSAIAQPEKLPEVASVSNERIAAVSELAPQESSPVESYTPEIAVAQAEASHEPALNQEPAQVADQPAPLVGEAIAEVMTSSQLHETQPTPEEPAIAQAAAVGSYATTGYAQILHKAEHDADPKPESDVVKSTAAAWASWRQTRDNGDAKADSVAESNPGPSAASEPPQDSAAMAVAAGAEHMAQEASAEPAIEQPAQNTEELANIVDSVLADLRPKLMAEISRKMSQKK